MYYSCFLTFNQAAMGMLGISVKALCGSSGKFSSVLETSFPSLNSSWIDLEDMARKCC